MKFFPGLLIASAMLCSPFVSAAGNNAAPFGVELGVATMTQVKATLGADVKMTDAGPNKFTGGPMLDVLGPDLNVDGVQGARFVFDKSNVLAGVIVVMDKDPNGVVKSLGAKYKLKKNNINKFMNNGSATFEKGDSVILLDAPHMSFTMENDDLTKSMHALYNRTTADEAAQKQKRKETTL